MDFIKIIAPFAQKAHKEKGVLASLTIAQAILESNWGKSGLAVKGNNLFGIKGTYKGNSVTMRTAEYNSKGEKYYIDAAFRKYPSFQESIDDHADLFVNGLSWDRNHYKPVVNANDYKEACVNVQKCGYATDPAYTKKLIKLIEDYKLYEYDKAPAKPKPSPKPVYHMVVRGDTCGALSKKFGSSLAQLKKWNKLDANYTIRIGEKIRVK